LDQTCRYIVMPEGCGTSVPCARSIMSTRRRSVPCALLLPLAGIVAWSCLDACYLSEQGLTALPSPSATFATGPFVQPSRPSATSTRGLAISEVHAADIGGTAMDQSAMRTAPTARSSDGGWPRSIAAGLAAALIGSARGAGRSGHGLRRKSRLTRTSSTIVVAGEASNRRPSASASLIKLTEAVFCTPFAVWLAVAAIMAVRYPASFSWVKPSFFTNLLALLMFSVGITTTVDDFLDCFKRPGAVAINFLSCYGIMPALAYCIAKASGAEGAILAGMVLVGAINGGQASNLCTLIAGGDVALSVLMTTSTTLGCIFMTPLICKLLLGAVVPIDAVGIVKSTFEVVLAPIFFGVGLNTLAPKLCRAVAPLTPMVGVVSTVLLVGASVAGCAEPILGAGLPLQAACLSLHLFGGLLGYVATKAVGYDQRTCRTVAIETAMKSSAFGFLLASLHFGAFNARVPPAVSVVWMAIVGSCMAAFWKAKPIV